MNSIKNLERLQKLHSLILHERTGPPRDLASVLHVSERLIYCLIEELKDYQAIIGYDRKRKTYYYQEDFMININVSISVLSAGIITTSFNL